MAANAQAVAKPSYDEITRRLDLRERELEVTQRELNFCQDELNRSQLRVEALSRQMVETNEALSVVARNLENARLESEKRTISRIRSMILPIVERLSQTKHFEEHRVELDMLVKELEKLTGGLAEDTRIASNLTFSEMRIASMIQNGLTSREISDQLHISLDTVKTHRRNIRRKLEICGSNQNLRAFLASKVGKAVNSSMNAGA